MIYQSAVYSSRNCSVAVFLILRQQRWPSSVMVAAQAREQNTRRGLSSWQQYNGLVGKIGVGRRQGAFLTACCCWSSTVGVIALKWLICVFFLLIKLSEKNTHLAWLLVFFFSILSCKYKFIRIKLTKLKSQSGWFDKVIFCSIQLVYSVSNPLLLFFERSSPLFIQRSTIVMLTIIHNIQQSRYEISVQKLIPCPFAMCLRLWDCLHHLVGILMRG